MKTTIITILIFLLLTNCSHLNSDDYYKSASAKLDSGDRKGAISDLTKAIELNPNNAYAYFQRAKLFGDYDSIRKLADFNKAIELDSNFEEVFFIEELQTNGMERILLL